jgi:mannose-6-phosphate isomerase-like protein (cupin superfamily)
MEAFFSSDEPQQQQVFYRASDLPNMGQGCVVKRLVGFNHENRAISLLHETYPPACDTGPAMQVCEGEQAGLVISGELDVTVDGKQQLLAAGDAYYITSAQPYRFRNPGNCNCVVVTSNNTSRF